MMLKPEGASYLTDALHQGNVFHFLEKIINTAAL